MSADISRRSFLQAIAAAPVVASAVGLGDVPDGGNVKCVHGYDKWNDISWVRYSVVIKDREYHDLVQCAGNSPETISKLHQDSIDLMLKHIQTV